MPKLLNTFHRGIMDTDTDKSLTRIDRYRRAENLRFHINDENDGVGVNIKGTVLKSDETGENTDLKCIGAFFNEDLDVIYYKLASTDGQISMDIEYNIVSGNSTVILSDTNGVLNYDKTGYITGWNEIDGLQIWSEWGNNPRRINTERAKAYGEDGFTEDDITLIVEPPLQKLKLTLQNTSSDDENHLKEIFVSFSYRYRYLDGEYSVLAPFTEFAFEPETFRYDFSSQSNESMVNKFNQVLIEFNTGSERVVEIQLVFKESESNTEWIIDDFNKALLGYGNDQAKTFQFNNNKVSKRALSDHIIRSTFDNVPLTCKSQTMIEGRLLLAYYKENYDIKDDLGAKIEMDYSLEVVSIAVPNLIPLRTCKTNRSYEVVIVYIFDYGRHTTTLKSKTDTIYIPNSESIKSNSIDVLLKNKPPDGAKHYRFFVKQTKKNYDQLLPTLFYEDGVYRWVKLEGADKDKVKEGDYLIVKSDSQGIISELVKTKVLEVVRQEKNFLQPEDVIDEIKEISGLYFKVKPDGYRLNEDDFEFFQIDTYHNARRKYHNCLRNSSPIVGPAYFYGTGLDDLTSSGTSVLADMTDKRFLIQIDGTPGTDTFRWSIDDGASWVAQNVAITAGSPQALSDGVEITFVAGTGHTITDEWNIYARGTLVSSDQRAYGFFRILGDIDNTMTAGGHTTDDEIIEAGARITLEFDEYNTGSVFFELNEISTDRYANIQEWFYKEGIGDKILLQEAGFDLTSIFFMRGILKVDVDGSANYLQYDADGYITMVIESQNEQTSTKWTKVRAKTVLFQSDGSTTLLFETEPQEQPYGIFYEIGKTYDITNGFHIADSDVPTDVNQTAIADLRVKLDFFNAYSYGNAVESYKIKDEFNRKGLDVGIRVSTESKEEYKEVTRVADITWSDVYEDETNFNGLNTFNLSLINFVKLDKENSSIQKLQNFNSNLRVYQEDAIGIMPYNKNIIYDVQGGQAIGITTNILNKQSYRPYASGLHGISKNPESLVQIGSRTYLTDRVRGDILRLANDGITEINENFLEHYTSDEMNANKGLAMVAGYDPKKKEYLLHLPNEGKTLGFKEKVKGFPNFYTFEPDFMLNANNEVYAWEDGKMYILNASATRNNFFGVQYQSKIKFYVNHEFGVEKVFKALGLHSTHAWLVNLSTDLTSRQILKNSFTKIEDYWYSEIMGNTNSTTIVNSTFGLGTYAIVNGEIITSKKASVLSVGDHIISSSLLFPANKVLDIQDDKIVLEDLITTVASFLMYTKNQGIDGSSIRGDVMEVEMISDETEKVEIKAVSTEVSKSFYS